tara:strand:+ start:89 stop:322 length:234 start_codon:yes stop_codon:yes gene_type:complete
MDLTIEQCRENNSDKLENCDLWITGDGTPFPATNSGLKYATKWRRRNGLALFYCKKTQKKATATEKSRGKNTIKKSK